MKKIIMNLIGLMTLLQTLQAQKHDAHWMFYSGGTSTFAASYCSTYPPQQQNYYTAGMGGIDFNTNYVITRCDSMYDFVLLSGYVSMSDEAGNYIFSTDGKRIIDSTGNLMPGGDSLSFMYMEDFMVDTIQQTAWVYASGNIMVLPWPGHPGQYIYLEQVLVPYYVASLGGYVLRNAGLRQHLIDMNTNGGRGSVVVRDNAVVMPIDTLSGGGLAACRHANGRDWWIIQPGFNNNCYYRLLLDPTGLLYNGKQCIGDFVSHPYREEEFLPVFSPDGQYYGRANAIPLGNSFVSLFKFDRETGLFESEINWVPNLGNNPLPGAFGFAASSRVFYVGSSAGLHQYKLNRFDLGSIEQTEILIEDTRTSYGYQHPLYGLQYNYNLFYKMNLGLDDWLYFHPSSGYVLSALESPDSLGSACNLNWLSRYLPVVTGVSLPNHPHYRLGALTGSVCDTLGLSSLQSNSYWLDFGQVEAGSSATLGIDVVSRVGYPASLDTLQYRQSTGVFSSSLALPTMLPKYDTLHYDVTFSPTASGYVEDTLELHSNYGVVRVRLTGNGISSVGTVASQPVSVQLYPNPASNTVTVYSQGAEIAQASLYSSRGELLKTQSIAQSKGQLDLAGLAPGLYLVELVLADGRRGISKLLVINY